MPPTRLLVLAALAAAVAAQPALTPRRALQQAAAGLPKLSTPPVDNVAGPDNEADEPAAAVARPPAPAPKKAAKGGSPWSPATIRDLKRTVVSIDKTTPVALAIDGTGGGSGTGFVVDADAGLVVTNHHIATSSPTVHRLSFVDGSVVPAKVLYYDVSQDFAVLKFNRSDTLFNVTAVTLGNSSTVRAGDPVLLIGNNEGLGFSVAEGVVSDVRVPTLAMASSRPSIDIQTTIDSGHGSSGSPVWNAQNQVIGVEFAGDFDEKTNSATFSREVPINYVVNVLNQLRTGACVVRGDAGLKPNLVAVGDAVQHFKLPQAAADAAVAARGAIGGVPRVIIVDSLLPHAPAEGVVQPGDIVFAADGVVLADDLAAFDRAMDAHAGGTVPVTLYRNGAKLDVALPTHDIEAKKATRFARFAGATFQDLTEDYLAKLSADSVDGVLVTGVVKGTTLYNPLDALSIVTAINGEPTPNLDAFIKAASTIKNGDAGTIDVWAPGGSPVGTGTTTAVTYDTRFNPLEVYKLDAGTLEWVKET